MQHIQRTLDFDAPAQRTAEHVSEAMSRPPPTSQPSQSLVRPDRQLTYGGVDHGEWPSPEHDHDTITVDRIGDDIDGPSHRFVIKCGDTVEVYPTPSRNYLGEVMAVSHPNRQARVSLSPEGEGFWVDVEAVYPVVEATPKHRSTRQVASGAIAAFREEAPASPAAAGTVTAPTKPLITGYTLADFRSYLRSRDAGTLNFEEYRAGFERLVTSKESFQADLVTRTNAKQLAALATSLGCYDAKRRTKQDNAKAIFIQALLSYVLDGTVSFLLTTTYEEAIVAKVRATSVQEFAEARLKRKAEESQHAKALRDPETFFEFRTFLRERSEADLTDEQLARYDRLHADQTRERRAVAAPQTVTQFESEELRGCAFQRKEGFHDKRQCPIWIVQLTNRVEPAAFKELLVKAKMLGGWYSSFKRNDAGFQFLDCGAAERFTSLLQGDADRTDVLTARKERKERTAAERLHELATDLTVRADETIERSDQSLQNTVRRADIQAGVRGRAYADQALARTMHSIAEALSRGEAQYLDGIRHKTQIESLDTTLRLARWAHVRALRRQETESTFAHGRRLDRKEERPISAEDIRYAEYPFPSIYRNHLERVIVRSRQSRGVKHAAEKMAKRLAREPEEFVTFRDSHDVEALVDFLGRAKGVSADVQWIESSLDQYKRLQRANITDIHELRAALREYLPHRAATRGDDPVKMAERELIGKDLPGFFPTPAPVIERMLELAAIEPQHRILEPSCGKGDIVDAIKSAYPEASLRAVEINRSLADVLAAKGYEVEFGSFFDHQGQYDRIVMNPPFEHGEETTHVQHAYSLLAPGGRLVSVMSEGPFFRSDRLSQLFRDWFDKMHGRSEPLPEEAFAGRDAFRRTGVRTRLVIIEKPEA